MRFDGQYIERKYPKRLLTEAMVEWIARWVETREARGPLNPVETVDVAELGIYVEREDTSD